jgi:alpha-aminoadipic semialdehyde synthase
MFAHLPAVRVEPHELAALDGAGRHSQRLVYGIELRKPHLYAPRDASRAFDLEEFTRDPASYRGCLDEYAASATLLVHGIYWSPRFPRLLTRTWMRDYYGTGRAPRLRLIADITCDIGGSVESTVRPTTLDDPVYVYDPDTGATANGWAGRGPVVLALDKLPAEFPREATHSFGEALLPFVSDLAAADFQRPPEALDLPVPFRKAVIAHRGRLTEHFRYLNDYLLSE